MVNNVLCHDRIRVYLQVTHLSQSVSDKAGLVKDQLRRPDHVQHSLHITHCLVTEPHRYQEPGEVCIFPATQDVGSPEFPGHNHLFVDSEMAIIQLDVT